MQALLQAGVVPVSLTKTLPEPADSGRHRARQREFVLEGEEAPGGRSRGDGARPEGGRRLSEQGGRTGLAEADG